MNKFLLLIGLIFFLPFFLTFRGGWIEPDSYAFYNRECTTNQDFSTPDWSRFLFKQLGCDLHVWYFFQTIIWLTIVIVLVLVNKFFYSLPFDSIGIIGFSLSFIYSLLAIEDDFLAFPFLILSSAILLQDKVKPKGLVLSMILFLIALNFWKGTSLFFVIVLFGSVYPIFSLFPTIAYIFQNGWNDWGGSTEAMIGFGIVTILPFILTLFFGDRVLFRETINKHKKQFYVLISLMILATYQAKWGLLGIIFYPLFFHKSVLNRLRENLYFLGILVLFFALIGIVWSKPPLEKHWAIIDQAVKIQQDGGTIVNEWSVGRFLEYRGGIASQKGGFSGEQEVTGKYWLGKELPECQTINSADQLFLQQC